MMAGLMLIRPASAHAWTWAAGDAAAAERGTPREAARAAAGHRVIMLVPGTEVMLTFADVPVRNRGDAAAAIPWALEEHLVDEVETLHFAVGARAADERWPVAVVARSFMDRLLARCAEVGLDPHVLLPEPLALPAPDDDAWITLEEADRVTVRTGADSGFACEPEMLATVLAGTDAPGRLVRRCTAATAEAQWPESFAAVVAGSERSDCPEPLAAFAEASRPRLDLRQGIYARGGRRLRQLRRWRLPAALAAGVAVLALAHATLEHLALAERESRLRQQMEQTYREAFPDAERVVDPRAQMEGKLQALRGSGDGEADFLDAVGRVAQPLVDNGDIRVTELEWRQGTLDLSLRTSRLDTIDRAQQALERAGFTTELRGVERDDDRVDGRLRLDGDRE